MIPDVSLNANASLLAGSNITVPSHLVYGSTELSPDVLDTSIAGEFDRVALESVYSQNNRTIFNTIRTGASANNETLFAFALTNSSSGWNILFSEATIASLVHTTNFDVETTPEVEFIRA